MSLFTKMSKERHLGTVYNLHRVDTLTTCLRKRTKPLVGENFKTNFLFLENKVIQSRKEVLKYRHGSLIKQLL